MSEESSLDAALNAGFGASEETEPSAPAPEQVEAQPEPHQVEAEAETPEAAAEGQQERPRDATGKFATKPQQAATVAPKTPEAGKKPAAAPAQKTEPTAPAAPELKPPQHWKAAAREEWNKLPRVVQEEALRVQGEVKRVLQDSAQARTFTANFEKVLTPYRAIISGEPLQVVENLLQTAATLQTAPPQQKAQLVAQIIKNFSVDIPMLDAMLSGQQPEPSAQRPQQQAQRPEQFRDPRVDEMLARQQQERLSAAQREVQAFEQEAEFLDEPWPGRARRDGTPVTVRDLMANLIDSYSKDGIDLPLKEAYAQVVQQHPEISKVLRQREEARAAATAQATTQRTRVASSSIQSRPAVRPTGAKSADLDSILNEAFAAASGR